MRASLIIAIASIIFVTSCNRREAAPDIVDIFNKGQISNLIAQNKDKQKDAIALLEKGNRKFRVDKNTAAAVDIYTSSITTYPTAKAYFELGNASATEKKYDKAVLCYTMAEQMGFQPVSKLLYNKACAYSNLHNPREAFDHLEYAIEAGFLNKKQLTTDPDLELIRGSRFQDVFLDAMQGVENTENIVWESFMQSFNALVLPIAIDIAPVRNFNYDNSLSFEYEKYVSEMHERVRFSRGGGDMFYPYGTVETNSKYVAVIYVKTMDDEYEEGGSLMYFLTTYDPKGTIIDKMMIAGRSTVTDPIKTFNMNGNLSFEIKEFEQTYKYPVQDSGIYENEIVKTTLKAGRNFKITDEGKFLETGPALGAAAGSINAEGKKS